MILSQLRIGARSTTYAALLAGFLFSLQVSFFLCRFLFMQFLPVSAAIGLGLQVCRDWDYYCDQGHAPLLHLQVTGCIQYLKKIESHPKF